MNDLCPVAVAKDSTEDQCQPESAAESHLLLLKQKKYCDVTFTFPNLPDRIQAHEFCLKARSPVFAEIFRTRKSGTVQFNDIEIRESTPEIFLQFLEFIYADKLEVDIAGALNLLQLAQKYKVHPLTKKCEHLLLTKIPVRDSVKVLETASRYGRGDEITRRDLKMKFNRTRRKVENLDKWTGLLAIVSEVPFLGADAGDLVASSSSSRSKPSRISALSNDPRRFQTSSSPRSFVEGKSVPKAVPLGSEDNIKNLDSAITLSNRSQQIEDFHRAQQRFAAPPHMRAHSVHFVQRRGGFQVDHRADDRERGVSGDGFWGRNRRSNTNYRNQVDRGDVNGGGDHTRESRFYNNIFIYVDTM